MFKRMCFAGLAIAAANTSFAQDETEPATCETNPEECEVILLGTRLPTVSVAGFRDVVVRYTSASVSVLDEDDLVIRLSPNPVDQLRAVPGVGVSRSGSVGGLTQVRIRGAEANHTLVLYEGVELSDPVTGETDFGVLTALDVDRAEILRGSASSIFGSDAIGGVVAYSKSERDEWAGSGEFGSFETARGDLSYGQWVTGDTHIGLGLSGFATDGVDTSGTGGANDGSSSWSISANGETSLNNDWEVSALALFRDSSVDFDSDTDFDGLLNDVEQSIDSQQWILGGAVAGETGPVDHVLRANFNSIERATEGSFADTTRGERFKMSYSPSLDGGIHRLTGLIDFEAEDYERSGADTTFGDPNQTASFDTLGLATEYAVSLDDFELSASARYDDNDGRFDDAINWRLGANYDLSDFGARFRASVGTGTKNPTFTELFGFFPVSFVGNPDLNPEQSLSFDIGIDKRFHRGGVSISYFDATLEDEIFTAFNPDFTSTSLNRDGESDRSGFEVQTDWQLTDNFALAGQLTQTKSKSDTDEDEIRVPEFTAALSLSWDDGDGRRISGAFDYVGEQDDFNFGAFPAERVTLDSYTLFSLSGEYPVSDTLSLTLRGENLFDEEATDVFGYNSTGAGVFIGLKLR